MKFILEFAFTFTFTFIFFILLVIYLWRPSMAGRTSERIFTRSNAKPTPLASVLPSNDGCAFVANINVSCFCYLFVSSHLR